MCIECPFRALSKPPAMPVVMTSINLTDILVLFEFVDDLFLYFSHKGLLFSNPSQRFLLSPFQTLHPQQLDATNRQSPRNVHSGKKHECLNCYHIELMRKLNGKNFSCIAVIDARITLCI